jgi:hypothetical protein
MARNGVQSLMPFFDSCTKISWNDMVYVKSETLTLSITSVNQQPNLECFSKSCIKFKDPNVSLVAISIPRFQELWGDPFIWLKNYESILWVIILLSPNYE